MGRVLELIKSEKLKGIRTEIEQFCESVMSDYLNECDNNHKKSSGSVSCTKNFYDSVWGTIEINEGEILILDSPILQRLRCIKQLGLADLLYSSANHSRFSHTLGVIQTADTMEEQIEKELKKKKVMSDADIKQLIRLSAIFHDSGHMFCSHASERFFQKNKGYCRFNEIDAAREYIYQCLDIKPSLSEIISVFIVQSSAVRKLFSIVSDSLSNFKFNNENEDVIIEKICCFIWGYPYSERMLPYSQIISGQIDSDKLDYLKRDSHSTGVPAAVDMSRVFQKLRVVETKKEFHMKSTSDDDVDTRYTIAIAPAAINTVDQLIISRYMMYENVYFHQKTLTAEEILRYALMKLDNSTKGLLDNFKNIMLLKDSDVIHEDFSSSIKSYVSDFKIIDEKEYNEACLLLRNLYKRKLFKRSVAFTTENLINVGHRGNDFYSKLFTIEEENERQKFVSLIKDTVLTMKELVKTSKYNFHMETDVLLIIAPDVSNVSLNSNLAIAEKNNKYRDMEFEADNWLKSRSTRKPQNYIVTYAEDRYLVYLATEYVLLKEYGLMVSDSIIYDDKDRSYFDELRKTLEEVYFYKDMYALIPNGEINRHNRAIEKLVREDWKQYELISEDNGSPSSMDETYLSMYIKQFARYKNEIGEYELFVKGCIEMLKSIKVISKPRIFSALKSNMKKIAEKEGCVVDRLKICNIGNVQDSSAQISYQINSINEAFGTKIKVQQLEEALKFSEEGQTIVFVDDAFCSGKQIISVFETYMGVPLEQRQTKEEHVKELSDEDKDKLMKSKIYFSFIFYEKKNEESFIKRFREIGLVDVEIVASEQFPMGYFQDKEENDTIKVVKKYFERAGRDLLEQKAYDENGNKKENWPDDRIESSLLGYNNAQQLIVFAWNTPTYTMTALWMQGKKRGMEWYPLFPRIDK